MPEIYNIEEVKDQFIANTIEEYTQRYAPQMIDLAVYYLNDFVNNLIANELVLLKIEPEPEPEPTPVQVQRPIYQPPQQRMQQPIQQQVPPRMAATPYQPQTPTNMYNQNPFQEQEEQTIINEYRDPRTQRMRVDNTQVRREVAEMNEQLRQPVPLPPRNTRQPIQQQQQTQTIQDVNLTSEKNKTFVDKIKEMRNPRKKEGINPDE